MSAAVLAIAGCVEDTHQVLAPGTPIELTRITPNAPAIVYYSGLVEPARMVIDDPAALASVWARVFANGSELPPLPKVDFRRERVIVAALGGRATGGYGIEITGADLEGDEIVVDVVSTSPGGDCAVTDAVTAPVDIATIPRGGPVRFAERSALRDCGKP
jgi:hypothetical protein